MEKQSSFLGANAKYTRTVSGVRTHNAASRVASRRKVTLRYALYRSALSHEKRRHRSLAITAPSAGDAQRSFAVRSE